jgi:foldase protein PrsA
LSKKLKPQPKLSVAKRQPPRWQHERNLTLIVWIVIPLVIALALGLVGYWGYNTYVAAWTQPVVKIGNETIGNATAGNVTKGNVTVLDMRYYVKMLRFYSLSSTGNTDATTFPYQVLQQLENDELVIKATPGLGIQVSPDEVTEKINNDLISSAGGGGNSTGNITGNITLPQTDLGKMYQQWLNYVRLSDSEYRHFVAATLLTQELSDQITQSVPTEAKQVHVYAIKVDNQANATEVENRLKNGEDFATLVAEYSTDNTTKQYGGDLGWLPEGVLSIAIDPQLDQAAFSLPAGNISEPIATSKGFYVIKVAEIAENRPVDEQYRQILASNEFTNWFKEQRNVVEIREYLNQTKVTWAMNHIT